MTVYQHLRIKDANSNSIQSLVQQVKDRWVVKLADQAAQHYGLFHGLFGLASNEVYWITAQTSPDDAIVDMVETDGCQVTARVDLVPTVRPVKFSPPEKEGIYVFRWFEVMNRDVDEIADLSKRAWVTFEGGFDTEIQGLFAAKDRSGDRGRMVLLTWYKDLSVWQDSRTPAEEARALFRRRHSLTLAATPICTRLIDV